MAFVRNPVVYVPDLTNGRPIVDGKVYLLTAGTVPPTQDSAINPADLLTVSYVNEAGNTVTQPQPLYTSKGGCLYGSFPQAAAQYSVNNNSFVFAAYNAIGELQYSAETTGSDYVESGDLAATDSTVVIAGVPASLAVGKAVTLRPVVGELNAMPRIIAALNAYDVVYVVGDLPITTTNPTALVNKKLIGFRGVSSLTYAAGLTGTVWTLGAESSIEGISHIGPMTAPDVTDGTTYAASADEALALKGIGSLSCIKVQQQSSKVQNCEFTGFSKWAIETSINNVSPNSNAVDTNISDNRIVYNYGGIDIPAESEYMKFLNNSICWNVVGVNKAGGNNTFTGNNIDHNRINFITRGGANNSHGGITGGTMNHGKLAAIIAKDITVGEAVSGVNFFDSGNLGIWIENSVGVNIVGNLLGRTNVYCVGRSTTEAGKPGVNTISNNLTNLAGATYQFRRNWNKATGQSDPATPDNCIFRNNYHMEGQASRDGSNWDEYALNDTDTIDSDGFKAETTIAGVTASRYVTGQPIGGAKFLGAGNVTGAIKIVLPVSSFNNSLCTFRISLSTSNGRGASFEFDAYALTGGTWSTLQLKSANGYFYKVRFGRTASGQPVLYIGELATVFTNTFVNIERFTMHQGAWAQSRYWKRGWVISSEPSAFENVTLETPDAGGGSSRIDFSGDLNTIATDSKVYAVSAANTPTGLNGFCTTIPRLTNSGVRSQFFHQTDNKIYVRFTATGDAGYSAWVEK